MSQKNFRAQDFPKGSSKGNQAPTGLAKKRDADRKNQPEESLQADYYDENSDSHVKFENGADNGEGGDLVEDPTDAANGQDPDVTQEDLEDHITPDESGYQEKIRGAQAGVLENTPEETLQARGDNPGANHQDEPAAAAAQSTSDVPDGTAREVLDWVGDDSARAQQALDAEQANDKPRKSVVGPLEDLLAEETDEK